VLVGLTLLLSGVGIWRLGIVPTVGDLIRLTVWLVVSLMYIGFWLALAMLFSVWLRRASTSALASIAAWLVATLFAVLLVGIVADVLAPLPAQPTPEETLRNAQMQETLSRFSPGTLYEQATGALLNPTQRATGLVFLRQLDRALPNPITLDQSLLIVWSQVVGLIALTLLTFAAAYISFMRQEVRA
ncbi:MAG TPA: ABC transporter permease subunit, partial [Actinomycetota bacterium]|nr:ABC transporter permease subunit [Actinomycetota bacterium]